MKTTQTYLVPARNLDELKSRIDRLNKRAARIGCEPIACTAKVDHLRFEAIQPQHCVIDGPAERIVWIAEGKAWEVNQASMLPATKTGRVQEWHAVEVIGDAPQFAGWSFVATLEPIDVEGERLNLIQAVPGQACPIEYRGKVGICDHCHTRRQRSQTFVVRHESGECKAVGRSCLKDFLGHKDPHVLAAEAELLAELSSLCEAAGDEDWLGGGMRQAKAWDLERFLTGTATIMRKEGWMSRTKVRELGYGTATADKVLFLLNPPASLYLSSDDKRWLDEMSVASEEDATLVVEAVEWAKGLTEAEITDNNYLANVNALARAGYTNRKAAGFAASILVAYGKAKERAIEIARKAARPESRHVGKVGERLVLKVTVENIFVSEGKYGTTGIHRMTDESGNDLVWFASGSAAWLEKGETYTVKATVKGHDEFRGRKQTVLTRLAEFDDTPKVTKPRKSRKATAAETAGAVETAEAVK